MQDGFLKLVNNTASLGKSLKKAGFTECSSEKTGFS
jgi:hypothetical protein